MSTATLAPMWAQARDTDLARNPRRMMSWVDAQTAVTAGATTMAAAAAHYATAQGPNEPVVRYLNDALAAGLTPGAVTVYEFTPFAPVSL